MRELSTARLWRDLVLTLIVIFVLAYLFVGGIIAQAGTSRWTRTQGTVLRSECTPYGLWKTRLEFEYKYDVDRTEYTARGLGRLTRFEYFAFGGKQDFADKHPAGSVIDVWFNPDDPAQSAVSSGIGPKDFVPLSIILLVAIGMARVPRELLRRARQGA